MPFLSEQIFLFDPNLFNLNFCKNFIHNTNVFFFTIQYFFLLFFIRCINYFSIKNTSIFSRQKNEFIIFCSSILWRYSFEKKNFCENNTERSLQLIIGVSVPINLEGRLLSYAHNFQFQYPLPPNNSDFSSARLARRRRSIMSGDRSLVYRLLELEWQR